MAVTGLVIDEMRKIVSRVIDPGPPTAFVPTASTWVSPRRLTNQVRPGSSARCTLLQTSRDTAAGTALLVEPPVGTDPIGCFDVVARAHGLVGTPMIAAPQPFRTAVSALPRRAHYGDGRAPLVVAGDAAQTGHVFSGQTCFVNLALALDLVERLRGGDVAEALAGYEARSEIGAALLERASYRHHTAHRAGQWAFAGVATA